MFMFLFAKLFLKCKDTFPEWRKPGCLRPNKPIGADVKAQNIEQPAMRQAQTKGMENGRDR
jgi:hypothetical protein